MYLSLISSFYKLSKWVGFEIDKKNVTVDLFPSLSAYQKILSWEPLLELVSINFVEEAERKSSGGCSLTVGDSLAMKIVINYNGPKVSDYGPKVSGYGKC